MTIQLARAIVFAHDVRIGPDANQIKDRVAASDTSFCERGSADQKPGRIEVDVETRVVTIRNPQRHPVHGYETLVCVPLEQVAYWEPMTEVEVKRMYPEPAPHPPELFRRGPGRPRKEPVAPVEPEPAA